MARRGGRPLTRRRTASLWGAALISAILCANPALAQTGSNSEGLSVGGSDVGAPIPLFPPSTPGARPGAEPPEAAQPESAQPKPALPETAEPTSRRDRDAIEIRPLTAPSIAGLGLLSADRGGFGPDLWRGTPPEWAAKLVSLLPAETNSPAAANLLWRLLASEANPPGGGGGEASGSSFLALRLERLYAAGQTDAVGLILNRARRAAEGAAFAGLRADLALLEGDLNQACALADAMRKRGGAARWLELSAFCAARRGDAGAVQVAVDLLSEEDGEADQTFLDLLHAQNTAAPSTKRKASAPRIARPAEMTALHYAMYRAAGIPVPPDVAAKASLAVARAIARDPQAEPATRLEAAERAAAAGAVEPRVLADLYAAAAFEPAQLADPIANAARLGPALGDALLFQAATQAKEPREKAAMIRAALSRAREQGRFLFAARIYAGPAADLTPTSDQMAFAGTAAQVLLAAGRADRALEWYALARSAAASGDETGKAAVQALWPAFVLALPESRFPGADDAVADWVKAAPKDGARYQAAILAMLEALGRPVPDQAWWTVFDRAPDLRPPGPALSLRRLLAASARDKRLGETVLEALVSLRPDGPLHAGPDSLAAALAGLRAAGLDDAARGLARDAALAWTE